MGTPFFVLSGGLAAWGKGLPSASRLRAGHVPPAPPACGPTPCPPCAAAVPPPAPSSPLQGLAGEMWRPRPGKPGPVKLAASRSAGHPCPPQGQARKRAASRALPRAQPALGCGAGAPGRPGPHDVGGCGAVRPSGPVGGTPASLASPATPAAQAVPRGSAYALAARRSGAAALAASSGQAGPRPAACGLAPAGARNLYRRAHWRRKRRLLAHSRAAGRGERRLRAGVPAVAPAGKAKASPAQGGKSRPQAGALPAGAPASEGKTWRVSRPLAGSRPSLILVNGGAFMFAVACRISASGRVWWLVCRSGGVFGWSLSRPARSLWPSALAAASACQLAAESAPGCFWPAGAPVGRLAVVRCK